MNNVIDNKNLLKLAFDALEEVNAKDIKIYETKSSNPFYSYAIVATCVASRQMDGLASVIFKKSKEEGFEIRGIEGRGGGTWLLIDLYDIIINLFSTEDRRNYDLDRLWVMLPQIDPADIK